MAETTPQGTVLVVDDTEANRYTIVRILQKAKFEVQEATNGVEGLARITPDLDLIILDIRMPEMDGYEAAARIKANPATRALPILHISATYTESKDIAYGLDGGADGYLTHPVDPEVLVATVRALVRMRRANKALRNREAEARARAEELQALMTAVPTAVILAHDPECTRMTGNPAAHHLFGLPAATELTGWPPGVRAFQNGTAIPLSELPIQKAAREGIAISNVEFELVFDDGSRADILGSATPLFEEPGRVRGAVGSFVDVTERMQARAQLERAQRIESIGRLAGGFAHETNNQMTVVLGFTDFVLRGSNLSPDQRHDLGQIKTGAERVAQLTRQLLALSRRQPQNLESLDLDAVVLDTQVLITRLLGPDIAVHIRTDGAPKWVRADRTQLVQVLLNLAINARDAMPEGGNIEIFTAVRRILAGGGRFGRTWKKGEQTAILSVRDSGAGIDPAVSARIFEPFFTTKAPGQGTGLGLSVVEGIVEQSRGDILVESTPGRGTTFTIVLPIFDKSPAIQGPPISSPKGGTETILVVDDEEALRNILVRGLQEQGYRVLEASNGRQAIEVVERFGNELDLVITDVAMPELNGADLARFTLPKHPSLPFIFISGQPREALTQIAQINDAATLLEKPFTHDQLAAAVRESLDRKPVRSLSG